MNVRGPEPFVGGRRLRLGRTSVLAKQLHLLESGRRGAEEPATERIDRQRQDQVEDQLEGERVQQYSGSGRRFPEHVMEDERADRVEQRHDRDGDERCVRAVSAGRLAVAPDPVAGDGQQERGDAEGLQRRRVDDEAGAETGGRAEDRSAEEGDRYENRGGFRDVGDHRFFGGNNTTSELSVSKLTNGCTCTCL